MASELTFNPNNLLSYTQLNQFYTSQSIKDIVKRHCQYIRDNPYADTRTALKPIMWTLAGGTVGFYTSTAVADCFKIKEGREIVQIGGTITGSAIGAYLYTQFTERSVFFKSWKDLRLEMITNSGGAIRVRIDLGLFPRAWH